MEAQGIFANIDHRDKKSNTNLLVGYRHLNIEGGARWFSLKAAAIGKEITKVQALLKQAKITVLMDWPKNQKDTSLL